MSRYFWWLVLGWGVYAAGLLVTLAGVPFHPDESTYLYTSRDFELWLQPARTAYQPAPPDALMQHYRLIDAPLLRHTIGGFRWLTGQAPLPADWVWAHTWAENAAVGAVPSPALLWVGRFPAWLAACLTPLLVLYVGRRLGGWPVGVAVALLYALNALVLLHTRRAMSESLMLLGNVLTVALLLRPRTHPAWVGLSAGLAFAAKLTGVAVVGVSVFCLLLWPLGLSAAQRPTLRQRARAVAWGLGALLLVTVMLNPILWSHPGTVLPAMWQERQQLLAGQVATLQQVAPGSVLTSPGLRGVALLYHLYFAPLSFWEAANYAAQTGPAEVAYQALGFTQLGHSANLPLNLGVGGVGLIFTLFGVFLGARQCWPLAPGPHRRRMVVLLWTALTLVGMFTFPMAWQRYYLPLLPCLCLWLGYGLTVLKQFRRGPSQ